MVSGVETILHKIALNNGHKISQHTTMKVNCFLVNVSVVHYMNRTKIYIAFSIWMAVLSDNSVQSSTFFYQQ